MASAGRLPFRTPEFARGWTSGPITPRKDRPTPVGYADTINLNRYYERNVKTPFSTVGVPGIGMLHYIP